MTAFYVLTQRAVVGPFTGVELREAALAGIIRYDGIVGSSKQGPWFRACDIGLFSENRTPLPHPPDVAVPRYQVRGMPGAFQGPFKLRELIGFASRGMLPADAMIQRLDNDHWIPVSKSRILRACLFGKLVLIDARGKLLLRNISTRELDLEEVADACVPIEFAKPVAASDATTIESQVAADDWDPAEAFASYQVVQAEHEVGPPSRLAGWMPRGRIAPAWRAVRASIPPRVAIQAACLLVALVGVASAYSFWNKVGLRHDQILGDWIVMRQVGDEQKAVFGLSFREHESCVLFNTHGGSWTGQYDWEIRADDSSGFENIEPFTTVLDTVSPQHERELIAPTDGYIRLRGFVTEPVMDGHRIRDLFLRKHGKRLKIGYPTEVHWSRDAKLMEAGWLTARRAEPRESDLASDLKQLEVRLPVPIEQYGGERPWHLSRAVELVEKGAPKRSVHAASGDLFVVDAPIGDAPIGDASIGERASGDPSETVHACLAYSLQVDASYLLEHYGVPDEAHVLLPMEVPELRNGPSFEETQVARYGSLRFIFSRLGKIRYLEAVDHRTHASLFANRP